MKGTNGDSLGIRQLQQRIRELEEKNKTFEDYNKDLNNQLDKLEEENKILKELNVCVGCGNNPDYKSRIDKAIEHITSHQLCYITQYKEESCFDNHLLDILKGEDNDENK